MAENDFAELFAESAAEVAAGSGENAEGMTLQQNAKIFKGDGEVIDPQSEESDEPDDSENDDEQGEEDTESEGEEGDEPDDAPEDKPLKFDLASHANELVTVKVNGEPVEVTVDEALKGFMRQADYTRKSQENAELRKAAEWGMQMRDALLNDPEGVINGLAQAMNVKVNTEPADDPYQTDDPEMAPLANKLKELDAENKELKGWIEQQRQKEIDAEVKAELQTVREKYSDFDENAVEVLQLAVKRQLGIEEAYLIYTGQKNREVRKQSEEEARKIRTQSEKELEKRKAAKKIASGSKRNAPEPVPANVGDSFEDMLTFALDADKKRSK